MHPILARASRFILYLLAWVPVVVLMAFVLVSATRLAWPDAMAVAAPSCGVYAFVCLAAWYVCRAMPLGTARALSIVLGQALAACLGGLVFAAVASGFGRLTRPGWALIAGTGALLYLLSAGIHYAYLALAASRVAQAREFEARVLAREAELRALRAQVNPHFLFNTLHSISALTAAEPARAREMCIRLSDFLRGSLRMADRDTAPLGEELEMARNYLEIEQVRFGPRLRLERQVEPGCEPCPVPALLLQPLVENAVKHGIAGLVDGGTIRLEARTAGSGVAIVVENDFDVESQAPERTGLGLANVRKRLRVRYGDDAVMSAGSAAGRYRVELKLPSA